MVYKSFHTRTEGSYLNDSTQVIMNSWNFGMCWVIIYLDFKERQSVIFNAKDTLMIKVQKEFYRNIELLA